MRSYPIWLKITSCIYKSAKSYGVKQDGKTDIYVGSSAQNSHLFGTINITHRELGADGRSFRLYLDGHIIKEGVVKNGELTLIEI